MRIPLGYIHRGMGQGFVNPAACENYLPGMPTGTLPQCDLATGGAPGVSQAEIDTPFCGGFLYGTAGYATCMESSAPEAGITDTDDLNPAQGGTPTDAQLQESAVSSILASLPVVTTSTPSTTAASTTSTSAPSSGSAATSGSSSGSSSTLLSSSTGCFQLFGSTEPCWGPIGEYTLLLGIAAAIGLFLMMGKR